jgi:hypothetical protein
MISLLKKDWLLFKKAAARVKLPSSAIATKDRHFWGSDMISI